MKKRVNKQKGNRNKSKISKPLYWTPRILALIFAGFLALFSLDVFDPANNYNLFQTILALLIHNIPVFILLIIIWLSWKREIVGGITFILAGFLYIFLMLQNNHFEWYMLSWILQISGIAFLIGILFLINWKKKRK